MPKQIVELGYDPFRVSLADRYCSVFINSNRSIFMDEGKGENRINGAVLYPEKGLRFSTRRCSGFVTATSVVAVGGLELWLSYAQHTFIIGTLDDKLAAEAWVAAVNLFLAEGQ